MAKDENDVSLLKVQLDEQGIMNMVRRVDEYIEILVPSREIDQAHNIIIDTEL